jgi:hypothetical protein
MQAKRKGPKPKDPAVRFFAKVIRHENPDVCWGWSGAKHRYGYGRMQWKGAVVEAHRISFEIHSGQPIPAGMEVCHSCDNPVCSNPNHLFLGTNSDNRADSVRKSRHGFGVRLKQAKLNPDSVQDIRRRHQSGESMYRLAKLFHVSFRTIHDAVKRITWKQVA